MVRNDDILPLGSRILLKVAGRTVYGLLRMGDMPAPKVGGHWRLPRLDIDFWMVGGTGAANPQTSSTCAKPSSAT